MRAKSFIILVLLLSTVIPSWAIPPQPSNIQQGMVYNFWDALIIPPAEPYGHMVSYMIDGTEKIEGVDALLLNHIDTDGTKKYVTAHLYTVESKVYYLRDGQWKLLYDFGLQPGEEMSGEAWYGQMEARYRCRSIIEHDEEYGGWSTMLLDVGYFDEFDNEWKYDYECKWIIGVGSTEDFLAPTMAGVTINSFTKLESFYWQGEQIFKIEIAGMNEVATEESTVQQIFDLEGRRIQGSPETIAPGVYIQRDGDTTRKILVK